MLLNYLTIAYRNLLRHKAFSAITISGLAISMAAFLLILQYVFFEKSYDSFHEQANSLYRIDRITEKNGEQLGQGNQTAIAHGPALKEDISEVAEFARLHSAYGETIITYENQSHKEKNLFFVDASFLQMFTFPLLKGDKNTVLAEPNSLIISQSAAKKYFGGEDPVGKTLTIHDIGGKHLYMVKGIFKDMLANTAIVEDVDDNRERKFDFLLSNHEITQLNFYKNDPWEWSNFITYVRLHPSADPALVQSKLTSLSKKYTSKGMAGAGIKVNNFIKPLPQIHSHAHINLATGEYTLSESGKTVVYLSIVTLFILGIGYINYINLSTARAVERAKEVGIRKVVGASRIQIMKQFLLDAMLISSIAFVLAITAVQLALPYYKTFTGKAIPAIWHSGVEFWGVLLLVFIVGALLSGVYPAFSLSAFQPITVLKGKFAHGSKGVLLRKGLVVFQFAMSILLIAGTVAAYRQISYMRTSDLGVTISQTLVVHAPIIAGDYQTYKGKWEVFKNELKANKGIKNVTASTAVPGQDYNWSQEGIHREGAKEESAVIYSMVEIDADYVPAYELELAAGKNFENPNGGGVLLNETAARNLGFASAEQAIGGRIVIPILGHTQEVRGVLKDYHQKSLQYKYDPIIYAYRPATKRFYSLKVDTQNLGQTMAEIEADWNKLFPGNPFEAFFLDESFNEQYKADQQFGYLIGFFSGLAILIACMGLFGLASFTITQRTKEIGVRKVLGASVGSIFLILSKDFIKLVAVASLVAWPLSYWSISQWLQNYEYRIALNAWLLMFPSLLVLLIALLTISVQTLKAARSNPVKALKYE